MKALRQRHELQQYKSQQLAKLSIGQLTQAWGHTGIAMVGKEL